MIVRKVHQHVRDEERRLQALWAEKAKGATDFDIICDTGNRPFGARPDPLDLKSDHISLRELRSDLTMLVMQGHALTKDEYHIAIGLNLLVTELPYEEFFTERWFEDENHRGYGKREDHP